MPILQGNLVRKVGNYMEVILLKDIKGIGKKGESKTVSDGYAKNFLIPKKLVVRKTPETLAELKKEQAAEEKREEELKNEALKAKEKLETIVVEFKLKAHADKTPAGSISTKEVEKELKDKYGITIDKRKFIDKYPLNAFGYTNLKIELYKDVIGTVRVHLVEDVK